MHQFWQQIVLTTSMQMLKKEPTLKGNFVCLIYYIFNIINLVREYL